ncbi:MAG TPA: N-acetylmuramoyl-L-alanine amidase [Terriglobales bacterium]|nr:N-acetylmuramoyl-L-alanine amidase [Terriglobales bacterium]
MYYPNARTAGETPLQTLLALVYLNQQLRCEAEQKNDAKAAQLSSIIAALYKVATGRSDLDQTLASVVEAARCAAEASGSVIALRRGEHFVCCARSGLNVPELGARLNPNVGISGECVRNGAVLRCDETRTDPRVNAAACRKLNVRSMLAVPISDALGVVGLLEVCSDRPNAFGEQETSTLLLLSSLVTHALDRDEPAAATGLAARPQSSSQEEYCSDRAVSDTSSDAIKADLQPGYIQQHRDIAGSQAAAALAVAQEEPTELPELLTPVTSKEPFETPASIPDSSLATFSLAPQPESPGRLRIFAITAAALMIIAASVLILGRYSRTRTAQNNGKAASPASAGNLPTASPEPVAPAIISDIQFHSHGDFTAIKIKLERHVLFKPERLHNPERVYFDLPNTQLGGALAARGDYASIGVNDRFISRIRVSQTKKALRSPSADQNENVTRIVLDLNCECDYSALLPERAPFDLSIVVQQPSAGPRRTGLEVSAADIVAPVSPALLPARMVVVLDPGHGGWDLGTVGANGLQEKDLALDVAQRLGKLLEEFLGAEVLYTRTDDQFVSLETRSKTANDARADLFLSIHANSSSDPMARGVETYFFPIEEQAAAAGLDISPLGFNDAATRRLAAFVQRDLYRALRREDAQIRDRGVKQAPFVLLTNAQVPAVLTEIAFLSSPADERNLLFSPARDTVAAALFKGVAEYFKSAARRSRPELKRAAAPATPQSYPVHGSSSAASH